MDGGRECGGGVGREKYLRLVCNEQAHLGRVTHVIQKKIKKIKKRYLRLVCNEQAHLGRVTHVI
jgi:hypothetical protein